jgi:PEP-CTERM motif-containing protein
MARRLWLVAVLLSIVPAISFADNINIGVFSFDTFIPGDVDNPGLNVFSISNLTGNPFGCDVSVDTECSFPVLDTTVIFQNSSLTYFTPNGSNTIDLGNIGLDGFTTSEFPDTDVFTSAIFSATLSQTNFQLWDGTLFTAASSAFSAELIPSLGLSLTAGTDLALLTVASAPVSAPVPEPSTVLLLGSGLAGLIGVRARSRRNSRPQCTNGS